MSRCPRACRDGRRKTLACGLLVCTCRGHHIPTLISCASMWHGLGGVLGQLLTGADCVAHKHWMNSCPQRPGQLSAALRSTCGFVMDVPGGLLLRCGPGWMIRDGSQSTRRHSPSCHTRSPLIPLCHRPFPHRLHYPTHLRHSKTGMRRSCA